MRIRAFSTAIASALLGVTLLAQSGATARNESTVGRTAWGDPDLQGVYTFATDTPLEAPQALTDIQRAEAAKRAASAGRGVGAYNSFWTANEKRKSTGRVSLIVDPPDGRIPAFSPRAQKIRAEIDAERKARMVGDPVAELHDTWKDHPPYERCIARPLPRISHAYNHGVQILQSPGQVVIHYESMHDVRVIPVDGRPPLDPRIRQWNGDSRGRWDGGTLVVEWTNFTDKQMFPELAANYLRAVPQGNMRFVERFTRVDATTIDYVVTVDDPTSYLTPWTFALQWWRSEDSSYQNPEDLYEFACHEGNYRMMENSLTGSQALRKALSQKN